jgi:putative membrane protein
VPFAVGAVTAWAALAFMMYSDHAFAIASFLIDPVLAGVLGGLIATVVPPLVRWLTPASIRRRAVITAARATFVERGLHHTRGRTGVLVYCALTEGMAAIVVDTAVVAAVPAATLSARERAIDAAIRQGGIATADAIAALAPVLAAALPRAADDLNELPDAIDHDLERRPRS